ncbi:PREDICTED: zinc finger protein 346-like isoform X2 [Lupinus angustifolius]|uniref:zinc finger protein 346-like isoform X2 n=1 Tax=Lupinus angustifolius TaxID=3871 RepID=UPI00092FD17D|nr:PREDICTED: zinc finger protein 346-like isoform X2 [Lupinus angustifolius]
MYPQQQHLNPFPNLQQQSYSSNPFLLSFPQLSSYSSLHPPGTTDPLGNSIFNLSNPTHPSSSAAYDSQTALSQNWIVQQSDPIGYGLAVGSSYETSAASNQTLSHQVYANYTTIMTPNQSNVTNAMKCEVCKIDCNSRDVYEKHISGKKHKRTLQVQSQISSIQGQVSTSATIDSVKICTACNIVCNSQEVLNKHLAGKKHCGQVSLMSNNGVGPYIAAFKRHSVGPWKKAPKKIKVAQSAWCAVCKINCNSRDVYIVHLSGRKHLKNLEKLSKPKIDAGAMAGNALQSAENSIIGPQEKPSIDKQKSPKASEMDIEAKKRKVVEGGASAAAVRLCTLCNVVCNSQTVFNTHLTGQKHAAAVKKQSQSTGSTTS